MLCKKCGCKIDPNWRCCLNCGELNPIHPKNATILNEFGNEDVEYLSEFDENSVICYKTNRKAFLIVNIIIALLMAISFASTFVFSDINLLIILLLTAIMTLIFMFYIIVMEKLYIKANMPWWGIFIPVYSQYLYYKMAYKKKYMAILMCLLPFIISLVFILLIALMILSSKQMTQMTSFFVSISVFTSVIITIINTLTLALIAKRFGMSIILTILFPGIVVPVIALSKSYNYVN